jgi:HD superfamily phosphohydrolase
VVKQIACPVHGTIPLTDLEVELLGTRAMQRLRNVKQLGLVPYVFPGADFSRLSHSLGVCHVTGLILDSLRQQGQKIAASDYRDYRLAAFVHDIGHYPFSHTTEHALEDFYGSPTTSAVEPTGGTKPKTSKAGDYYDHEHLGGELLELDVEIRQILSNTRPKVDPKRIAALMRGEEPGIGNLVKSDLDADRLDYLPRTAIHAGLPYGRIDLGYLVSQISTDRDDRLCFSSKALNAVDHCLLARYFDRMTIAFHKTVVGFELLLEQVLQDLLELQGVLKLTKTEVKRMIQKDEWAAFDDDSVVALIREHLATSKKPAVKARAQALLYRRPLKLVAQLEYLGDRNDKDSFDEQVQIVERNIEHWRKESKLHYWTYWVKDGFTLTSLASSTPISVARKITEQELEESARIKRRTNRISDPVTEVRQSLMSGLGGRAYYALRVYALVARPTPDLSKVRQLLKRDLPGNRWVITV